MLVTLVATLLLGQRSEAEIQRVKGLSAYCTPAMERMMRATNKQLVVYAGSLDIEERGPALGEIVWRKLAVAPTLVKHLNPPVKDEKTKIALQGLTINALAKLGDKVAVSPLRKSLKSGPLPIRITSAFALASLDDAKSAEGIRALFPMMKDPMIIGLIRKLAKFGDKASEPLLRNYLETRRYAGTRAACAEALGSIGNRKLSVPALIKALKDDYPNVRAAAATSLAKLGDKRAIPALEGALETTSPQASNAPKKERESKEAIQEALRILQAG